MADSQILHALCSKLGTRSRVALDHTGARQAAVLVPLLGAEGRLELLLLERSADVLEHKGEICLPGGAAQAQDADAIQTALREAEEELALARGSVEVLGLLDDVWTTVSNYVITPVVGHVSGDPTLVADPAEVARVIRVPLARLLEPGVESIEKTNAGVNRLRYAYAFDGNFVWGATARILHALLEEVVACVTSC